MMFGDEAYAPFVHLRWDCVHRGSGAFLEGKDMGFGVREFGSGSRFYYLVSVGLWVKW